MRNEFSKESIQFTSNKIIEYGIDNEPIIIDIHGEIINKLKGHKARVYGIKILNNGNIVTWAEDFTLRIWNSDGACLNVLEGHSGFVSDIIIRRDNYFVSWSCNRKDPVLRLWSPKGDFITALQGHENTVLGALFHPNGKSIISWSMDAYRDNNICEKEDGTIELVDGENTLILWNANGEKKVLFGHKSNVRGVIIRKNGNILSWSDDSTIRQWTEEGENIGFISYDIEVLKYYKENDRFPEDVRCFANNDFIEFRNFNNGHRTTAST